MTHTQVYVIYITEVPTVWVRLGREDIKRFCEKLPRRLVDMSVARLLQGCLDHPQDTIYAQGLDLNPQQHP